MSAEEGIRVSVAYVEDGAHFWRTLDLPAGTTAREAAERSGVQRRFPRADPQACQLGVFGKPVSPERPLEGGERVELYRPITADPETVPRNDREEPE